MTTSETRPRASEPTTPRLPAPGGANNDPQANGGVMPTDTPPAGINSHPTIPDATPNRASSGGSKDSRQAIPTSGATPFTPAGTDSRRAMAAPQPNKPAPGGATSPHPTSSTSAPSTLTSGGATTSRQAIVVTTAIAPSPAGADSQRTIEDTAPRVRPSAGPNSRPPMGCSVPRDPSSGGVQLADRQKQGDAQPAAVVSDQPAGRQLVNDSQKSDAVGSEAGQDPAAGGKTTPSGESLLDPALALAADVLDDLERVRTANANRLRQLTRSVEDKDGEVRGFGLDESHPDVAKLAAIVEMLGKVETDAVKNLERIMRRHPLGPWAKSIRGVGDKQIARLLAVIGDPYVRPEIEREDGTVIPSGPRTVSALWAFCGLHVLPAGHSSTDGHRRNAGGDGGDPGHHDRDDQYERAGVAPKRARGQKANWSTKAKTRAYLIAESCLKQLVKPCTSDGHVEGCACSPYRLAYDRGRVLYADAVHPVDCARCGPSGKPAPAGSPLSAGHKHARAMRLAMKELLKDLWREAKRIHEQP